MGRKFKSIDFNEKVANRLRNLRNSKEWTQKELGRKLNIHPNSVLNHESGNYCHELWTMLQYCRVYGLEINQFLEGIEF